MVYVKWIKDDVYGILDKKLLIKKGEIRKVIYTSEDGYHILEGPFGWVDSDEIQIVKI